MMKGPLGEQMPPAISHYLEGLDAMARHISEMLEDLYVALEEGRPWSLVRMGDGEAHTLQGVHAPWTYYANSCATQADAGDLRQHSLAAIREADWVGWHQDRGLVQTLESAGMLPTGWTKWYVDVVTSLKRPPAVEEMITIFGEEPNLISRSQFAWCNLHMGIRRGFVEKVLRTQPLFLVGIPMQQWLDQVLRPAGLGDGAIVWTGDTTVGTMNHAMQIVDAFVKSPARVMFASLGVWALPIVGRAKALGKAAIDWGHAPDHHVKEACEDHHEEWGEPRGPDGRCPKHPACQAHWRYKLNTTEEDSPAGTMRWYRKAGSAGQCLPEKGYS